MATIVQKEDKVLRAIAAEVPMKDIGTPKLAKILASMKAALDSQEDGVAIAAPQIGVSLRIFLVSGRVLTAVEGKKIDDITCINPVILMQSKDKKLMEEGCLSVRYLYGKIRRSTRVKVEYTDEKGERKALAASGLLAQVFQHEIDHLEGILFIDNAKGIYEMLPEKMEKSVTK